MEIRMILMQQYPTTSSLRKMKKVNTMEMVILKSIHLSRRVTSLQDQLYASPGHTTGVQVLHMQISSVLQESSRAR